MILWTAEKTIHLSHNQAKVIIISLSEPPRSLYFINLYLWRTQKYWFLLCTINTGSTRLRKIEMLLQTCELKAQIYPLKMPCIVPIKPPRNFWTQCNGCLVYTGEIVRTGQFIDGLCRSTKNANHRRNMVRHFICITVLQNKALRNTDSIDDSTSSTLAPQSSHLHNARMPVLRRSQSFSSHTCGKNLNADTSKLSTLKM